MSTQTTNEPELESRELLEERELAEAPEITGEKLTGYAVKFNSPSNVMRRHGVEFREVILPGSLDYSGRVSFLFRHDDHSEYGDTETRTLTLTEDKVGIKYELNLPPYAKTLRKYVAERIVQGMSIGFRAYDADYKDGVRYIRKAKLEHVAAVINRPAYPDTTISIVDPRKAKQLAMKNTMTRIK